MTSHLTDECFADLLAGEGSSETMAHLAACEPCRVEAERIGGALGNFREQSLAWAARQARPAAARRGILLAFPKSLRVPAAAAVVLACGAMGGLLHTVDHAPVAHAHPAGSLADDNRLLLSIDQELQAQEPSPGEAYSSGAIQSSKPRTVSE